MSTYQAIDRWRANLAQNYAKFEDDIFATNELSELLSDAEQACIKIMVLNEHENEYRDDYRHIYTTDEILTKLKRKHPNTDLKDLKSLTELYPELIEHPHSFVQDINTKLDLYGHTYHHQDSIKVGKHEYTWLTNEDVMAEIHSNVTEFEATKSYVNEVVEYLLESQPDDKINNDWYGKFSYTFLNSPYSEAFYEAFKDADDIIKYYQDDIHNVATSCDYDDYDEDDMTDWGMQFDGYTDEVIDELKDSIKNYEKFMASPHDYMYNRESKPATIQMVIDFVND